MEISPLICLVILNYSGDTFIDLSNINKLTRSFFFLFCFFTEQNEHSIVGKKNVFIVIIKKA